MAKEEKKEETQQFWNDLGVPLVTLNEARKVIELCFEAGTIPCLVGHAGIGKTQIYQQIARERGMGYLAFYAQLCMPEDIVGLPFRSADGHTYQNLVDQRLWDMTQTHSEGILVFEEVNRASRDTASAVFAFMDNRGAGSFKLPEGWRIAIAQNPAGGEYSVNDLNSDHAFRRRVTWLAVREDARVWLDYARETGFAPSVVSFVQTNPRLLLDSTMRASGKAYANPAAWEKVSKTLLAMKAMGMEVMASLDLLRNKISGDIGESAADAFVDFVRDASRSLSPSEVISEYATDKSKIRGRVRSCLEDNQIDRVSTLLQGVVRELLGTKPEPTKELAKHIGLLFADLPRELASAFFAEFTTASTSEADSAYTATLNKRLSLNADFQKTVQGLSKTLENVDDEVNKGKK